VIESNSIVEKLNCQAGRLFFAAASCRTVSIPDTEAARHHGDCDFLACSSIVSHAPASMLAAVSQDAKSRGCCNRADAGASWRHAATPGSTTTRHLPSSSGRTSSAAPAAIAAAELRLFVHAWRGCGCHQCWMGLAVVLQALVWLFTAAVCVIGDAARGDCQLIYTQLIWCSHPC
jgi:hypothetical protein